jgi:hypothetical protein
MQSFLRKKENNLILSIIENYAKEKFIYELNFIDKKSYSPSRYKQLLNNIKFQYDIICDNIITFSNKENKGSKNVFVAYNINTLLYELIELKDKAAIQFHLINYCFTTKGIKKQLKETDLHPLEYISNFIKTEYNIESQHICNSCARRLLEHYHIKY